jgi:long-subunit fatty acid transport protein
VGDYGYEIGSGMLAKTTIGSLLISYELKENLYVETSVAYRKFDVPDHSQLSNNRTMISFGLRWNMYRRVFEF